MVLYTTIIMKSPSSPKPKPRSGRPTEGTLLLPPTTTLILFIVGSCQVRYWLRLRFAPSCKVQNACLDTGRGYILLRVLNGNHLLSGGATTHGKGGTAPVCKATKHDFNRQRTTPR
ncbi:unnamed protein product [Tuber melanosporum]|uniref:(Perigord truffle) hypothetical protein n=1 Tax=Tuber melanosporum (strain Mel28) TaxID=656061 RepID=D5GM87_TUBMM|nr:uncharacterized protein GSTUM_00010570001 [Tuber melanosporum]CAZ85624.1 unnamed protein product [Tuber melanosporum]